MKRLTELDVLRGILLLMMVVNHSRSQLRRVTDQPIGFFTTAEGFVFVSALLAGMLFSQTHRTAWVCSSSLNHHSAGLVHLPRTPPDARVCLCHRWLFVTEFPGAKNLLDQYLENPWAATAAPPLLLFQPPLLDMLPMYILFSLLTPVTFWAADRWGWKAVIFDQPLRVAYFADANSGYSGKRFTRNFVYRTWVFRYTLVAITLDCWRVFWPAF